MTTFDSPAGGSLVLSTTLALGLSLAAAVFAFDLAMPLGVAGAVPYIAVVLIGLWSPWPRFIPVMAAVATALTALGFVLSPAGGEPWVVLINRGLALFAIWTAALLAADRKRAMDALGASEARYRTLYHRTPAMLHSIGPDGCLIEVSDLWLETMGYGREDVIGRKSMEFVTEDSRDYAERVVLPKFLKTGAVREQPYRFVKKNGEEIDVLLSAIAERGDSGSITRTLVFLTDVSGQKRAEAEIRKLNDELEARVEARTRELRDEVAERRQAEEALRQSEARLQSILDNAPLSILLKDTKGRYVVVNRFYEAAFGVESEKIAGKLPSAVLKDRRMAASARKLDRQVLEAGKPIGHEDEVEIDGKTRTIHTLKFPVRDAIGAIVGLGVVATDITERKRVEEDLRRSESRLNLALGAAKAGPWVRNLDDDSVIWDARTEAIFGLAPGEFGGTMDAFLALVHPDDRKNIRRGHGRSLKEGVPYDTDYRAVLPDGSTRHIVSRASMIRDGKGKPVQLTGVLLDVTERREAEVALKESEALFRSFVDNAPMLISIKDRKGHYTMASPSFARTLGANVEDIVGKTSADFFEPEVVKSLDTMDRAIIDTGRPVGADNEIVHNFGGSSQLTTKFPISGADGQITGIGTISVDISKRIQAEEALRLVQDELVKKERLATLGQLTGTVSHELRNPLGTIRTALAVIEHKTRGVVPDIDGALDRMDRNVGRCDKIIDDMFAFTRVRELELELTPVREWLADLLDEVPPPPGIALRRRLGPRDLAATFDRDRLRRVIVNIWDNACHAMAGSAGAKTLTVAVRAARGRLEISLADTGSGMSAEVLANVFEPLYSTKSFGVGLGLPTVKEIMERHCGGVAIESAEGKGTKVILWLPLSDTNANTEKESA